MRLRSNRFCLQCLAACLALLGTLLSAPTPLAAQGQPTWNSQQVELSRSELETLLARYEETANSSAYSSALREQARREAALVRDRLTRGDFQVGDQIELVVEGEPDLSSAFVVQEGPSLVLPVLGRISLEGVLRSEVQPHLQQEIGRYIRNPVVHARSSVRLMITGGIGQSGYHVVPTNTVFSDMLMMAGGPANNARLERLRVERGGRVIWEGNALQEAIIQGRTLDQLSMQAGDHVIVPVSGSGGFSSFLQIARAVGSIAAVTYTLVRIFR